MIRIEELRVGNKVYFTEKQTEWEVSMLEENGVGLKKLHSINTYYYEFAKLKNIEPIEITEKNLIELGFKRDRPYLTYGDDPQITVTPDAEVRIGDYKEVQVLINPPLHQLQNLITDLK